MAAFIFYGAGHNANRECAYAIACRILKNDSNVRANAFPDFLCIQPNDDVISIEQVKFVSEFVAMKAEFGGYKVVIIERADLMTTNAANAILKTLEELPENCFVFLTTINLYTILATVRSRCKKYYIKSESDYSFVNNNEIVECFNKFLCDKNISNISKIITQDDLCDFYELIEFFAYKACKKAKTIQAAKLYMDIVQLVTQIKSPDVQAAVSLLCSRLV